MEEVAVLSEPVLPPEAQRAIQDERAAKLATQVGTLRLTDDQRKLLMVHATLDTVEVRPTGELYVPGVMYRAVLNKVFGPAAWGTIHGTPMMDVHPEQDWKSTLYLNVFLMCGRCARCARSINACQCFGPVEQCCVGMAIGAQAYHPRNARLSYDDALEAAITNGLMRITAKQLGSYSECWDPRWAEWARAEMCIRVPVVERDNRVTYRWRRKDRQPLDGEQRAPQQKQPGQSPPVRAVAPSAVVVEPGEVIGRIQRREPQPGRVYWAVATDAVPERLTDDEHCIRALEQAKAQGKKVVFEDEVVETKRGPVKKVLSYKII